MIDEDDLRWYLTVGISCFERSTFGAMLDAMEFNACGSSTCAKCGGYGVVDKPWVWRHDGEDHNVATGKPCGHCDGQGVIWHRLTRGQPQTSRRRRLLAHGEIADCSGVPPVCTAHCRSTRNQALREAPPDTVLIRYAAVSRRLAGLPRVLAEALAAAYGDHGEASAPTARGRSWAAAPLTPAGKTLLRHARATRTREVDTWRAVAALTEQARLDASAAVPERTKLLAQASAQASDLVQRAEQAWERSGECRGTRARASTQKPRSSRSGKSPSSSAGRPA